MRRTHPWKSWALTAMVPALVASPASALKLDFDGLAHGEKVFASKGVDIDVQNPTGADFAVAFLTTETGSSDLDLEMGSRWSGGNLDPGTLLDQILIIQEHDSSCDATICGDPDDEGSRPAGTITFDFRPVGPFELFSFDFVDVEDSEGGQLQFMIGGPGPGGSTVLEIGFDEFLGVDFGDNHANHVDLDVGGQYDTLVIHVGGSAGFDNLIAALPEGPSPTSVPEPSTAALLCGAALVALATGRRTPTD